MLIAAVIVCEIVSTIFIVWGITHEEKLVQFEDKIITAIRRDIRTIKIGLCVKCLKKEGFVVKKEGATNGK